jgi:hypothetical protein
MEQLTRQLQQLDHAPIGRAARAAWLKEQQQKRQLQQQQQQVQQADLPQIAAGNHSSSDSPTSDGMRVRGGDDSNPFAIPQEMRANWDADLEDEPRAPAPRRQISRAAAPSSGSRSGSRTGSRNSNRSSPGAGSDNPFAIPQEARAQWEAEDHMFCEPGKPMLGAMLGGLVTKLTSGTAQPSTARQHQDRRRQAMKAEETEAAAILRLQQEEQQQQARDGRASVAAQVSARTGLPPRAQQQEPPAAGGMPAGQLVAVADAVPSGFEGLEEGSTEWKEKMRQDMLQKGAARRARMQQMRTHSNPASQPGRQTQQAAAASSTLSAVSAADAQGVTAAIPAPQQKPPANPTGPVVAADKAAPAASDQQKVDHGNPFAV